MQGGARAPTLTRGVPPCRSPRHRSLSLLAGDSDRLITASADQTVRFWEMQTGKELFQFKLGEPCRAVNLSIGEGLMAFTTDAFMGSAPTIHITKHEQDISLQTTKTVMQIAAPKGRITRVYWSDMNRTLVTSHDGGFVRKWDTEVSALVLGGESRWGLLAPAGWPSWSTPVAALIAGRQLVAGRGSGAGGLRGGGGKFRHARWWRAGGGGVRADPQQQQPGCARGASSPLQPGVGPQHAAVALLAATLLPLTSTTTHAGCCRHADGQHAAGAPGARGRHPGHAALPRRRLRHHGVAGQVGQAH